MELIAEIEVLAKTDILKAVLERFGEYVAGLGYTEYNYDILPVPYITNRGRLYSKGCFKGPSPFEKETRPLEDISHFNFFVVGDINFENLLVIEVKHEAATLALFKITPKGIYSIDGELPHV